MSFYRPGMTRPTERIAIYGGKIPRTPYTCRLKHEEVREAGIRLPVEIHKFVQSVAVQTGYSQNAIINAMALYTVERPQCSREDAAAAFMRSLLPEHTRRALEQRAFDKGVSQMTLAAEIIQEALAD